MFAPLYRIAGFPRSRVSAIVVILTTALVLTVPFSSRWAFEMCGGHSGPVASFVSGMDGDVGDCWVTTVAPHDLTGPITQGNLASVPDMLSLVLAPSLGHSVAAEWSVPAGRVVVPLLPPPVHLFA